MERVRSYLCFKTSSSLLLPTLRIFPKLPSKFWHKPKGYATFGAKQGGDKKGLVSLYKDMELCGGYGDIQIMWEMIHSTCSKDIARRSSPNFRRPRCLESCFRPT